MSKFIGLIGLKVIRKWVKGLIADLKSHLSGNYVPLSQKGVANGVATLDANGLVPSAQLPSYVDDVLEFASASAFPASGESGKIYVAKDTNLTYRWSGTQYVEISKSLAIGETDSTAFAGSRGVAVEGRLTNVEAKVDDLSENKVDKETGKSLLSDTEIARLAGMETGATSDSELTEAEVLAILEEEE